jgi:Domain of unknown function (DUF4191)
MAQKAPKVKTKVKKERFRWLSQIRQAYVLGHKGDPRLPWVLLAVGFGVFAAFLVVGFLLASPVAFGILGVPGGLAGTSFVFGRRVERSVYRQIDGQPGAAMQSLSTLRRGFTVDKEPLTANRQQDVVWRVIGKCGVVLVSEGPSSRAQHLLAAQRKRHERVLGDIPIHEVQAGNDEGQVPIRKLGRTIMKLPRTLKGSQMTELDHRLKALSVNQGAIPIPKGPLPRGIKVPRAR